MATVVAATTALVLPASAGASPSLFSKCRDVSISVALTAGGPTDQTVRGTLCKPHHYSSSARRIDVLTAGATYNRSYWNFPYGNLQYSYVAQTLLAGRATFAYDTLGSGTSSHPVSTALTVATNAYVLHQVVQWARSSGFDEVNTVGHSLGSAASIEEAGTYHDVSRLVATGWFHAAGPGGAVLGANTYTATSDPKFAGQPLDAGYQTTMPGIRGTVFYYAPGSDSHVVAKDEENKDLVSATLRTTAIAQRSTPAGSNISNQVVAPVFTIAGTQDALLCGGVLDCTSLSAAVANETPYYTSAASLTVKTAPYSGHDIALHYSAPLSFLMINNWINNTPPV